MTIIIIKRAMRTYVIRSQQQLVVQREEKENEHAVCAEKDSRMMLFER